MAELELKFGVPDDAMASLGDALRAQGGRTVQLQAHYHDTADGTLAAHAIALRLRREGTQWVQTLKTSGDGVAHRQEHEVDIALADADAGNPVPLLDVRRHDGTAAGKQLQAVLREHPDAILVERHTTRVDRLHCLLHGADGTTVEAALDSGTVQAGGRSAPIAEFELEHKGGPVAGLFMVAGTWVADRGLWLSAISKGERGERLLHPAARPAAFKAGSVALGATTDGPALLRALLQSTLDQVLRNASAVAEGGTAAETVHQLRVGLRRLRTVLRELSALSEAIVPAWDLALSAAFSQLGERRDQDAVAAAVRPLLLAADAPTLAWQPKPSADPQSVVRDPAFQAALLAVLALAHAGADQFVPLSAEKARRRVAKRLAKLHRQVVRDGRRFERLPVEHQHRVRKRLKRLRYLAELTEGLWPHCRVRSALRRLSVAQDALGVHNDVVVAAAQFRADAQVHPAAWFAAGYLQAHGALTARAAHKALASLGRHQPFWGHKPAS